MHLDLSGNVLLHLAAACDSMVDLRAIGANLNGFFLVLPLSKWELEGVNKDHDHRMY